jgi:hypothetical protein
MNWKNILMNMTRKREKSKIGNKNKENGRNRILHGSKTVRE